MYRSVLSWLILLEKDGIHSVREHLVELVEVAQHAASGKAAMLVAGATASAPVWIERVVSGEGFQSALILLGAIVSITIISVNIQAFRQRLITNKEKRRQEKIRTALLENQAKEKNIKIDSVK